MVTESQTLMMLVQMFLVYYGLGQFEFFQESILWPLFREAYFCALFAFTLNTGAYTTEILRGAIKGTPHGEIEAAEPMQCRCRRAGGRDGVVDSAVALAKRGARSRRRARQPEVLRVVESHANEHAGRIAP